MWQTLIGKIEETLTGVSLVKTIFTTPQDKVAAYPAVFFKPAGFQNSFSSQTENDQIFRFMVLVMVGTSGSTIENAFSTVLPKVVDNIVDAFDAGWNAGTIEGHRVRVKIDSADDWQISEEDKGLVAWAPLNVEIRLLKNI